MVAVMTTKRRIALVTGATRGIGRAIAEELKARGLFVIVAGRDAIAGAQVVRATLGDRGVFHELDVTNAHDIETVASWIEKERGGLDVLVNNAGATFDGFDAEVARRTLEVNFLGTMRLTDRLLPLLRPRARVVMVSSGMGEVSCLGADLRREVMDRTLDRPRLIAFTDRFIEAVAEGAHAALGWPSNAYRVSKVAMNAYTRILARELSADPRKILVNAACPGWVRTAMGGHGAPRTPKQGAKTPVWLALLSDDGPTGGFFRDEHRIDW
jgi:NAD(P)-dependent dehydrogenase (short-subunit alcohol dehydrogenase family)